MLLFAPVVIFIDAAVLPLSPDEYKCKPVLAAAVDVICELSLSVKLSAPWPVMYNASPVDVLTIKSMAVETDALLALTVCGVELVPEHR